MSARKPASTPVASSRPLNDLIALLIRIIEDSPVGSEFIAGDFWPTVREMERIPNPPIFTSSDAEYDFVTLHVMVNNSRENKIIFSGSDICVADGLGLTDRNHLLVALKHRQRTEPRLHSEANSKRTGESSGIYLVAKLAEEIGVSTDTLAIYRDKADVAGANRGGRNHKFTLAETIAILNAFISHCPTKRTVELCKSLLATVENQN